MRGGRGGGREKWGESQESYRKCPFHGDPRLHPALVGLGGPRSPPLGADLVPSVERPAFPAHSGGGGSLGGRRPSTQLPPEGLGETERYQLSPSVKWGWGARETWRQSREGKPGGGGC